MAVGRSREAARFYLSAGKQDRRDLVRDASCDQACVIGYLRAAKAGRFQCLADIRNRKPATKKQRYKRKADFWHVLACMAEISECIENHTRSL